MVVRAWPAAAPVAAVILLAGLTILMLTKAAVHTFTQDDIQPVAVASESNPSTGVNFGVIIDAGSSGSRVFVYSWPPHSGTEGELIKVKPVLDKVSGKPAVLKVTPGLSTFEDTPENATESLQPLVEFAQLQVPKEKRSATPLFVMATAGMRLLEKSKQEAIMSAIRKSLPKMCDFQIVDEHVEIIDGKWEGIYSWIAVNYILNRFEHSNDDDSGNRWARPDTVGMIDMGGASVQIAFEFSGSVPKQQGHLVETVNLGCEAHESIHTYKVYVVTFLGLGANEAINSYERLLARRQWGALKEKKVTDAATSLKFSDEKLVTESTSTLSVETTKSVNSADNQNTIYTNLTDIKTLPNDTAIPKRYEAVVAMVDESLGEESLSINLPPAFGHDDIGEPGTTANYQPTRSEIGLKRRKRSDISADQLPSMNVEPHDLQPPPINPVAIVEAADGAELEAKMVTFAYDDNGPDLSDENEARFPLDVNLGTVKDPCLPRNVVKHVRTRLIISPTTDPNKDSSISLSRRGTGNFDQCSKSLRTLLNFNSTCDFPPCSMRGVHQPNVDMSILELFGFSEYWYSMHDILNYGGGHLYEFEEFRQRAKDFCTTRWSVMRERLRKQLYPRADAARLRTQCFKSAWIATVLHDGFGVPRIGGRFKAVQEIKGQEVQWTLGALLFKMRYFPLRDIEHKRAELARLAKMNQSASSYSDSAPSGTQIAIVTLLCISVILWAAYKYGYLSKVTKLALRKVHVMQKQSGKLPRPKSMYGYMMLDRRSSDDNDDILQGVRVEKARFIY